MIEWISLFFSKSHCKLFASTSQSLKSSSSLFWFIVLCSFIDVFYQRNTLVWFQSRKLAVVDTNTYLHENIIKKKWWWWKWYRKKSDNSEDCPKTLFKLSITIKHHLTEEKISDKKWVSINEYNWSGIQFIANNFIWISRKEEKCRLQLNKIEKKRNKKIYEFWK